MDAKESMQDLINNPEKYIFEFQYQDEEKQKMYEEGFYENFKKPNKEYDEYGLRFDVDYLDRVGNNIVLSPIEFMADYVDVVTKSYIDNNDEDFVNNFTSFPDENEFNTINATGVGNLAYSYLHIKDEGSRQRIKEFIIELFLWKANQYKNLLDSLGTIN